ncbi:ATP-binding protein [Solibacillus sp. FSL H8-0538]|uniref:ATP-binding protein n=1 Tax=Solibacillus sp. FSL H8-0538 TaxID=2921400 RepID=UPI0030F65C76
MEFTLNLVPNRQAISFVDQTMASYMSLYNLPSKRELCFVVHELVINAVEAMGNAKENTSEKIQIHVSQDDEEIKVIVIDHGKGIPETDWEEALKFDLGEISFSDRGRGLFFVKNMVDKIWFENLAETKFLVGVSKKIDVSSEEL